MVHLILAPGASELSQPRLGAAHGSQRIRAVLTALGIAHSRDRFGLVVLGTQRRSVWLGDVSLVDKGICSVPEVIWPMVSIRQCDIHQTIQPASLGDGAPSDTWGHGFANTLLRSQELKYF